MLMSHLRRAAAIAALATCVSACAVDAQQAAQEYLASGDAYLADGKLAEAIIEYRNAVQQDPVSFDARQKLGDALAQVGDIGNAAGEYVRAADLRPDDADAHVKAGAFLLVVGQPEAARDRAERALRVDDQHVRAQLLLGEALAGLSELDAAVEAVERAISLDPSQGGPYLTLGSLQFQRGEKERALEALENAVQADPDSAVPQLALARFHWVTGNIVDAEGAFRKAIDEHPESALANRAMAEFYVGTNRMVEAEPYLQAVADITGSPEAQLVLADFYARTGRPDEAVTLLEPLSEDPDSATQANMRLAALEHMRGQTTEAHERLSGVIENSDDASALLLSAELLMRDGRHEEALAQALAAVEADPRQAQAHFMLGRLHSQLNNAAEAIDAFHEALRLQPDDAGVARELARQYLQSGDATRALRFAEEAVAGRPSDVESRLLLAGALLGTEQDDRAAAQLTELTTEHPRLAPAWVQQGMLATRQGRHDDARRSFGVALEIDPQNVGAVSGLVALDLATGAPDAALTRAEAWVEERPDDTNALMLAARTHAADGDYRTAERYLRRILELDANNLAVYSSLGQLYAREGRLDDAVREYDTLAERSEAPATPLTMAGIMLQALGRTAEAQRRFERAVELDADAAVAANNLAWIYAESGQDLNRALELAQVAMERLPDLPQTNDTLGWVHYKRNLASLAVPYFEKSIEKAPDNPTYRYHLGLALAEAGDLVAARAALERALALQPDFVGAEHAKQRLAALAAEGL